MIHIDIYPLLGDKVKALRTATATIATIETHFAWIFLTRHHTYKLKKPVRLEGMDHTSKDARNAYGKVRHAVRDEYCSFPNTHTRNPGCEALPSRRTSCLP